jgi:PTS system galactitol-specific IIA component
LTHNQDIHIEGLKLAEENIIIQLKATDSTEVIRALGGLLFKNGYVKDTFVQAVIDREKTFPTGLQTPALGFAIPHTDCDHVQQPAVAVATLVEPVSFNAMGYENQTISVEVVMMLAVSDPTSMVTVLRSVISLVENEQALQAIRGAQQPQEVIGIIGAHIQRMTEKYATKPGVNINH